MVVTVALRRRRLKVGDEELVMEAIFWEQVKLILDEVRTPPGLAQTAAMIGGCIGIMSTWNRDDRHDPLAATFGLVAMALGVMLALSASDAATASRSFQAVTLAIGVAGGVAAMADSIIDHAFATGYGDDDLIGMTFAVVAVIAGALVAWMYPALGSTDLTAWGVPLGPAGVILSIAGAALGALSYVTSSDYAIVEDVLNGLFGVAGLLLIVTGALFEIAAPEPDTSLPGAMLGGLCLVIVTLVIGVCAITAFAGPLRWLWTVGSFYAAIFGVAAILDQAGEQAGVPMLLPPDWDLAITVSVIAAAGLGTLISTPIAEDAW